MKWFADIATGLALLTRLPVRAAFDRTAQAAWAWPIAGIVVGGLATLSGWLGLAIGLAPAVVAGIVLAVQIIVTGAIHEDGFADCADGFWGGFAPPRRLEIMRDSHLGTYGAIALILGIALRWTALTALLSQPGFAVAILSAAMLSRAVMLGNATALPHARRDGLSVKTGHPPVAAAILGAALALPTVLFVGIWPLLAAVLAGCAAAMIARAKIGGQTGDVLGATQQLAEIAVLLSLASSID